MGERLHRELSLRLPCIPLGGEDPRDAELAKDGLDRRGAPEPRRALAKDAVHRFALGDDEHVDRPETIRIGGAVFLPPPFELQVQFIEFDEMGDAEEGQRRRTREVREVAESLRPPLSAHARGGVGFERPLRFAERARGEALLPAVAAPRVHGEAPAVIAADERPVLDLPFAEKSAAMGAAPVEGPKTRRGSHDDERRRAGPRGEGARPREIDGSCDADPVRIGAHAARRLPVRTSCRTRWRRQPSLASRVDLTGVALSSVLSSRHAG